jgi:HlyD family secretion protein
MDRKIEKRKWPPRRIAGISVSGVFAFLIIYNLPIWDASSKINVDQHKITIATVSSGPFREHIPVTGNILPKNTNFLDAVEGGRVDTVFIEAGTFVNAGDEILQLENTNLHIQILSHDAQVVEQRNLLTSTRFNMERNRIQIRQQLLEQAYQIQRLQRLYQRRKELFEQRIISEQEYEETKDEYEYQLKRQKLNYESFKQDSVFQEVQFKQLENSLDRLELNLTIARKRLDALKIRAPITGHLTSLIAEEGQLISQGQRLGQIDELDSFKVRAAIDEHYLSRVFTGGEAEFDWSGEGHGLIIRKVFPEVSQGRFQVDLEFTGEAPDGIRRGQTLHIKLFLGNLDEAILIPRGGFYQNTGGQWIFVVSESGDFAYRRNIRLGRQNTQMFEVIDGLKPGEVVVTSSYETFGDMDKLIF